MRWLCAAKQGDTCPVGEIRRHDGRCRWLARPVGAHCREARATSSRQEGRLSVREGAGVRARRRRRRSCRRTHRRPGLRRRREKPKAWRRRRRAAVPGLRWAAKSSARPCKSAKPAPKGQGRRRPPPTRGTLRPRRSPGGRPARRAVAATGPRVEGVGGKLSAPQGAATWLLARSERSIGPGATIARNSQPVIARSEATKQPMPPLASCGKNRSVFCSQRRAAGRSEGATAAQRPWIASPRALRPGGRSR